MTKIEFWKDDEEAKVFLDEVKLLVGQAPPTPYHNWKEMTSDEAISRFFFYGLGSLLVALPQSTAENKWPELGVLVVDLDLSSLKVRDGFRPYGYRIHFDAQQKPTAIYDYAAEETRPNPVMEPSGIQLNTWSSTPPAPSSRPGSICSGPT